MMMRVLCLLAFLPAFLTMASPPTQHLSNLHEVMTRDEKVHYFEADSSNHVPEYDVIKLDNQRLRRDPPRNLLRLPIFGKDMELQLEPSDGIHRELMVERLRKDGMTEKLLHKPEADFYHGHVVSEPGSLVALRRDIKTGELSGSIVVQQHLHKLEPVTADLKKRAALHGDGHHVISRRSLRPSLKQSPVRAPQTIKRSLPTKPLGRKVIEYMITMDHVTSEFYKDRAVDYIANLANMVNRLYADPSTGMNLTAVLVKVIIIQREEPFLNFTKHNIRSGGSYLNRFSLWAEQHNSPPAAPEHFDNAVLITKRICGLADCSLNGLAFCGYSCESRYSASVNDDQGLQTAFSIAHEMAHNLGVDHDTGDCSGHIMTSGQPSGPDAFTWSKCSRKELKQSFAGHECYDNLPPKLIKIPSRPPGFNIDADEQCTMMYGRGYKRCPITQHQCDQMFCYRGNSCVARGSPPVDGTACGWRKWCMKGRCVEVGASLPPPVDGQWSDWGEYSACTVTCGFGVQHRVRTCTNPSPQFGGKDCVGTHKGEWRICKKQTCPNGADWRNEQCTTQGYPSQYYMSHAPCTLYCRRGNVAEILGPVADGTPCYRAPERRDVCIEGKCRIVGCDYSLDSGMDVDRCGKCAGDGSECVKVTKMYTDQSHTIKGIDAAVVMFKIPINATSITVQEMSATNNFMTLKLDPPEKNSLLIPVPSYSRTVYAAGTFIKYELEYKKWWISAEKMFIQGPTNAVLDVMYIFLGFYTNPGFKLTYHLTGHDSDRRFVWKVEQGTDCTEPCAGGERRNHVTCRRVQDGTIAGPRFCDQATKPAVMEPCNTQPCQPKWVVSHYSECSKSCAGGVQTRALECMQKVTQSSNERLDDSACTNATKPAVIRECNTFDCPPEWATGLWSECTKKCGGGSQVRVTSCRRTLVNGSVVEVPTELCVQETGTTPSLTQTCNNFACFQWKTEYSCANCSDYYHKGCYEDKFSRALPKLLSSSLPARAVEACYQLAKAQGYRVFGVQYGKECWAAVAMETYDSYGKSDRCQHGVGGNWANDVYFIVLKKAYRPIGCFSDRHDPSDERSLPKLIGNHRNNIDWKNMRKTVQQCSEDAWVDGMPLFGIQYYGECWSGKLGHKKYNIYGPSLHGCWSGVGGSNANFVYVFTSKVSEPTVRCISMETNTAVDDEKCDKSKKPPCDLRLCQDVCNL
ncbi:A disintegrin and metalloproteinase with thrombospondin motifs 7 [Nematostella vectensis]|uniref:A disintegrin and metalloproteinase with thrombospondin motifs 7 n=1 Tax=Nematostella vectensis TaxID=45351 RepID=UPI00207767BD|nr:A disintegrin and metalloproteinase with thrombospondin motifs 7 [Nematostella vectensis]